MKNSLTMLAVIATFLLTCLLWASFGAIISDYSVKTLMSDSGIIMCMFVFGWIPSVIVGYDLSEKWGL